ncbi:hypothetical protein Dalk_1179 [Desulfatibacillum aliphaticivorans]|uniref:Competence protein CoiA nuclease-like domain-containing protein n=1 Tax=Desulfatibacillum aliphaticivorans TaxID=218208 RepID=B8F9D6_DESAL|nr:hypothetical protein [Desulfatibacillum aliphaticivorans]ACL02882.1 hypothetical protein Dalk_1179 [Desulfatibacillum aliphaticivorans]
MARKPTRIIEGAMFDGEIGPVSAQELIAMPESQWGLFRDRITDRHNGGEGVEARCLMCGTPVFIQSKVNNQERLPYFAHYRGGDVNCPWYNGKTKDPEQLRAVQYHGQQESFFHRAMCEKLAEVVQLDERYRKHRIDKYLPPKQNDNGRFPDIYVEWEGIGPFVIEFQLSHTFQTEISKRCIHYEREGIPLIWILSGIAPGSNIPQNFRDVIRRHRGNAFVFDHKASMASFANKTLMLSCLQMDELGELQPPVIVRFDKLFFPWNKLPYFKDRVIAPRLRLIRNTRKVWFDAFKHWDKKNYSDNMIQNALSTLPHEIPCTAVTMIAAVFSIVAEANGKPENFASGHENVKGMLNGYLMNNNGRLAPYVNLLTSLIRNTKTSGLLSGSVKSHFDRITREQATEESAEWKALKVLIPEVLDPLFRQELIYYGELPNWANPE